MMFMFALTNGGACTVSCEHINVISGSVVEAAARWKDLHILSCSVVEAAARLKHLHLIGLIGGRGGEIEAPTSYRAHWWTRRRDSSTNLHINYSVIPQFVELYCCQFF
jgi:hypothetical protein